MKKLANMGLVSIFFVSMIAGTLNLVPQKASAAFAPDFQAANIIGDSQFFDSGSMTVGQIQQFLDQQMTNCDTNGTQPSTYGGGTRAQYGAAKGFPAPYTCLKSYYENPTTHANNLGGSIPDGALSSAQIISNAATTYGVNPKTLLATLQKESGLLTDAWPFPSQYKVAMGYGCPDTAPCDSDYFGFYNQVTNAAKQFQRYAVSPNLFRYKAGQNNTIQFNPNNGCGSSNIYIQNQATAGLYNYTPYQPNTAALNNLYGTGDGCSAYGNRNFWRMYTDYFGSTLGSDLVRTANDATVYLISGANRYPIADGNVLNDYSALGNVLYVSDSYINAHTLGAQLGHMVGGNDGTIYFVDAGIKLPFSSCAIVADYGYDCSSVIHLNDVQLSKLSSGPYVTSLYQTTSGKLFYISGGVKREVFNQAALAAAGITGSANVLLEGGIAYLPYGAPVIQDNSVAYNRADKKYYLYNANSYWTANSDIMNLSYIKQLPVSSLDDQSILNAQRKGALSGFVSNAAGTSKYILLSSGKALLTTPASWSNSFDILSDQLLGTIPDSSDAINNQIVKSSSNGTVYYIYGGAKHPISSWGDLLSLQIVPLTINTLSDAQINNITVGTPFYGIGMMVKSPDSGTVYIVKGTNQLLTISSFLYPQELGIPLYVRTMRAGDISAYAVSSPVQTKLVCNGTYYIGNQGKLYSLTQTQLTQFGFAANDFVDGAGLCAALPLNKTSIGEFLRGSDGTIYVVQNGRKQAFTNYPAYISRGGTAGNTIQASDYFLSQISNGANISQ